jgi:hypothetical protein
LAGCSSLVLCQNPTLGRSLMEMGAIHRPQTCWVAQKSGSVRRLCSIMEQEVLRRDLEDQKRQHLTVHLRSGTAEAEPRLNRGSPPPPLSTLVPPLFPAMILPFHSLRLIAHLGFELSELDVPHLLWVFGCYCVERVAVVPASTHPIPAVAGSYFPLLVAEV